jgi:HPt (histidine-containing phosphotransfer) domain-containing protein
VMDGLTATTAIRAIEQKRGGAPIPIIALTANARPQDVAMSGSAGCNQHLSKPISRHKLLSTIEEYHPMTALLDAPARHVAAADAPAPESQQSIEIEMPLGLEDFVPAYLAARREELPEMMALLAASSFVRLGVMAHDIKGTGSSFGFPALTRLGAGLENSAKLLDTGALDLQLTELKDYLGRVQLFAKL